VNVTGTKWFAAGAIAVVMAFVAGSVSAAPTPRSLPASKKTSFTFNNIPVRSALQLLAEEGHFNLVVSDSVQGNISVRLNDVTWQQALEIVLRLKGLHQQIDGQTRTVGTAGA
jgi:type IV pilus assembly protein PilQ